MRDEKATKRGASDSNLTIGNSPLPTPHSSLATRWWKFIPAALLLATTFGLAFFELSDYDIWYHLRAGELIPQNGVPEKDWFCFKSEGEDWIDVHWGFQRIVALLYGRFGSAGLVWMKSCAAVLAMAFVLSAYRKDWPRSVQALAWVLPLLMMSSRFYERPEIFTLVFTAIYLHVLFHAEQHPGRLWVLPFVQAAWANVQGLFIFGPIILGMYWAEAVLRIDRVRGLFRHLMPVTLLVFAACIASPYSWRNLLLVMQISQTATTSIYRESIAELKSIPAVWQDGGYTDVFMWLFVATMALSAISTFLALPVIWRERRLFRLLPPIAFGYVGLQAIRNGNHFALVAGTAAAWNLGSLQWKPRLSAKPILLTSLLLTGLLYAVVSEHWYLYATPTRAIGTGERPNYYPREAMRKAGVAGAPMRALVMHNGHAALYEYMNYTPSTPRKTYTDARLEVHTLKTYKDYIDLTNLLKKSDGRGDQILKAENIGVVSVDGDQYAEVQAALFNDQNWVCVHYDEISALFFRSDQPLPAGLSKWDPKEELFRNPTPLVDLPLEPPSSPLWFLKPPSEIRKGKEDLLTVRAGYVWEKMGGVEAAPPEAIRIWNMIGLQAARRAAARRPWKSDSYRALGYAALGSSRPNVTLADAEELCDIVPVATAMFNFKQALKIDPSDFYSRMWLGQQYSNLGAYDLAEQTLHSLEKAWPRDRQQVKVLGPGGQLSQLIEAVKKKRTDADALPASPNETTSKTLDYLQRGLAKGDLYFASTGRPSDEEQAIRWARLFLLTGDPAAAERTLNSYQGRRTSKLSLVEVAISAAKGQISGISPPANIEQVDTPQIDWLRAWLAIQAGDRETARKAIADGKSRNPPPSTAHALDQLELMVK